MEINGDTIALLVTALLGLISFFFQAHQGRVARAEETERERAFQRTTAQFQRTDRWLDECCRPIFTLLVTMSQSRVSNVGRFVSMLEKLNPAAVEKMLALESTDPKIMSGWGKTRPFFADGAAPHPEAQLTRYSNGAYHCYSGEDGYASDAISFPDHITPHQQPAVAELPQPMLDCVAADPTGPFAHAYRLYIREVLVPRLRQISAIIEAHGAYIEYPPMSYFEERFPGEANWNFYGPTIFMSKWLAYTQDWQPVLAEWDDGVFSTVRPRSLMPFGGLFQTITWSRTRAEKLHFELTGMMTASSRGDVTFGDSDRKAKDQNNHDNGNGPEGSKEQHNRVAPAPERSHSFRRWLPMRASSFGESA